MITWTDINQVPWFHMASTGATELTDLWNMEAWTHTLVWISLWQDHFGNIKQYLSICPILNEHFEVYFLCGFSDGFEPR